MKTNPQLSSLEGTNTASGREKRKIHIARKKTAHFNFLLGAGGLRVELIKKIWFSGREAYGQDKENSILGIKLNAGGIA